MSITVTPCPINGLYIIAPEIHRDGRGFFAETYNRRDFHNAGLSMEFVQDNLSRSAGNVLRGLHYQKTHPQGKLVRVSMGTVFDVAVDLRPESHSFGQWFGVELSAENARQFYIPAGFAHGFYVLSDGAEFCYKTTDYYRPGDEGGILWNDGAIGIEWPIPAGATPLLSPRDAAWPALSEEWRQRHE